MHLVISNRFHRTTWAVIGGLILAGLISAIQVGAAQLAAPVQQPASSAAGIAVVDSADNQLKLSVNVPDLQQGTLSHEGQQWDTLSLAGYDNSAAPGQSQLPQHTLLLALPPGHAAEVSTRSSQTRRLGTFNLQPGPHTTLLSYDASDPLSVPEFEKAYVAADSIETMPLAQLGDVDWVRGYRVVPLHIRPIQANLNGSFTLHSQLDITVSFVPDGSPYGDLIGSAAAEAFDSLLSQQLINYDSAQSWRRTAATPANGGASPCLSGDAWRIETTAAGIHKITPSDLPGYDNSGAIANIKMCSGANEIAIYTDGNGSFDGSDTILFYAEALKTHDTTTNVYWLTVDNSSAGLRMASAQTTTGGTAVTTYTHSEHLEQDLSYLPFYPLLDPNDTYDHWFWQVLGFGFSELDAALTVPITSSAIPNGANVSLQAEVWGFSSNSEQHRFELTLNDSAIGGTHAFTGGAETGARLTPTATTTTSSTITSVGVRAIDNGATANHRIMVNWLELSYDRHLEASSNRLAFSQPNSGTWAYDVSGFASAPLVFDVTNAAAPRTLAATNGDFTPDASDTTFPASYALTTIANAPAPSNITLDTPSDLRNTSNQADYIIITDASLTSAIAPLVAHRQSKGLTVKTVLVQDIFDEFGYGIYSTDALRDFLYYALNSWSADAPAYVLLAGDGSYDHRDVLGVNNGRNLVPTYLRSGIDPFIGETASDNQYVAFGNYPAEGELPSMHLGRLPASNTAEMTTMVNKIIAYEQAPLDPIVHSTHIMLSDNALQDTRIDAGSTDCEPDPAHPDFFGLVDGLIADHIAPHSQLVQRLYYAHCFEDNLQPHYAENGLIFKSRLNSLANQGAGFITYVGHSGIVRWGDESFFTSVDAGQLGNDETLSILLPMTCLEGQYHSVVLPQANGESVDNSVSEALLKNDNGGAVASYAPTGLAVTTGHDLLWKGFYDAMFDNDVRVIGSAVFAAKTRLNGSFFYQDLHDTFILLGDPAMEMKVWTPATRSYLPLLSR